MASDQIYDGCLFLIVKGIEKSSVITELFTKLDGKPNYQIATDYPLVLYNCEFKQQLWKPKLKSHTQFIQGIYENLRETLSKNTSNICIFTQWVLLYSKFLSQILKLKLMVRCLLFFQNHESLQKGLFKFQNIQKEKEKKNMILRYKKQKNTKRNVYKKINIMILRINDDYFNIISYEYQQYQNSLLILMNMQYLLPKFQYKQYHNEYFF